MKALLQSALAILLVAAPALSDGSARADGGERPVVVELFTSQGCSSCPPADALLGELARLDNVLALSFNVDYWDYIGWKDTYASPVFTARQRAYMRTMAQRYVYTPQLIIDGVMDVVGSHEREAKQSIDLARSRRERVQIPVDIEAGDGGSARVTIGAGRAPKEGAAVWMAVYDSEGAANVARGENAGRKLVYHNVVRELTRIGTWTGAPLVIDYDLDEARRNGHSGCAVIVQIEDAGAILGAYDMKLAGAAGG
jgi:hypothetical protein